MIKSNRCTCTVYIGQIPEEMKKKKGKGTWKESKRGRERGRVSPRLADKVAAAHIM